MAKNDSDRETVLQKKKNYIKNKRMREKIANDIKNQKKNEYYKKQPQRIVQIKYNDNR